MAFNRDKAIRPEGFDYYTNIMRHLDRMGDQLSDSIDVGKIGTSKLVGYYNMIIHLEGLLIPFLEEEFYQKRRQIEKKLPGYAETWSADIGDQIKYFLAISDLFQLLILVAYKSGVLKIKRSAEYRLDDTIL